MPKTYLDDLCKPDQEVNPLFTCLGIEVGEIRSDHAVLRMTVAKNHIQGAGIAGGGVLATLLDEAMAHAVLGGNPPGKRTTTIDMSVRYLRPVQAHTTLDCEARVTRRGRRVVFAEATVRANGLDAAQATASFLTV